ncbi:MAG TPA: DUF3108 domain-containing protein [Pyrinomonadaceae bacterium]|nr:DUF3108 domain-containing protein [Pyrinomonadaceae bacterium]HMP64418.1 DUF3108 domain-containing protein [Pyrinomonadaceae bacterium]
MNRNIFTRFLPLVLASLLLGTAAVAQHNGISDDRPAPPPMPFRVGEKLVYDGKLSRIISVSIGELTFTVNNSPESEDLWIRAEARSKGTLISLFRFSFRQEIDSTVDRRDFFAQRTVKVDIQKDRVRNSEANFDYSQRRVTYVETDPKEPMRPPRTIASELEGETHDLISGIYQLRMLPLEIGKEFEITVSDSGLVYRVPVKVTGRERIRTAIGRVWCLKVEPQVFGPGRMIEQEGGMTIWITDDRRRVPVRSSINTSFGRIDIRIKSAENLL